MRNKYRSQDYYSISSARDGLYYAAGIPRSYWEPRRDDMPTFKTTKVREGSPPVTKKTQEEWYARTTSGEFFTRPFLFLLTSPNDDTDSLRVGYNILKFALESDPMIRVHVTESSKHWVKATGEKVFMLSNVYDDAPRDRVQAIRDWSTMHEDSFRIICAAGDPEVLVRRTKLKFNAVFQVNPAAEVNEISF